jgi:hypothetical protein
MNYNEYELICTKINDHLSIILTNKKALKKINQKINCLIPIKDLCMKYEQSSVILGSHGHFYITLEPENDDYEKATDWYNQILHCL